MVFDLEFLDDADIGSGGPRGLVDFAYAADQEVTSLCWCTSRLLRFLRFCEGGLDCRRVRKVVSTRAKGEFSVREATVPSAVLTNEVSDAGNGAGLAEIDDQFMRVPR